MTSLDTLLTDREVARIQLDRLQRQQATDATLLSQSVIDLKMSLLFITDAALADQVRDTIKSITQRLPQKS